MSNESSRVWNGHDMVSPDKPDDVILHVKIDGKTVYPANKGIPAGNDGEKNQPAPRIYVCKFCGSTTLSFKLLTGCRVCGLINVPESEDNDAL